MPTINVHCIDSQHSHHKAATSRPPKLDPTQIIWNATHLLFPRSNQNSWAKYLGMSARKTTVQTTHVP
jgi:hypothetical protein